MDEDSLKLKTGRVRAHLLNFLEEYDQFLFQNQVNLKYAYNLSDSTAIAVASSNIGSYYRYTEQNDSSYYYYNNVLKFLNSEFPSELKADAYYIMADVQHVAKLYEGAESDAINALAELEKLPVDEERLDMYSGIYNLLAILSKELGDYKKAIEYYNRSIEYAEKIEDGYINIVYAQNNIANTYRELGQIDLSLQLLRKLEKEKNQYEKIDPSFYGTVLNNIALGLVASKQFDFFSIQNQYRTAYKTCFTYGYLNGALNAQLDLCDLFLLFKENDSVLKYANQSLKLSDQLSSNEAKQRALVLLAEVTPGEAGKAYLKEHIRLGDSLETQERLVRNKIARIKFDTDQIQAKNEQISKENFYLLLLSIGLLLTGTLVYIIITQRAKNRQLRLQQAQQEANEEIYNLMLNQQDKIEEARAAEKTRVSKELHDGVLGRLFGVRLSLDSINFSEGKEAAVNRSGYIQQLKTIEEDLRSISHEMNTDFVAGAGFSDILQELVETQCVAYGLGYKFSASEEINWESFTNKIKINLYRIVQESMQNVYKHAQATEIDIAISLVNNDICLKVKDNGQGFDVDKQRRGIGLKNMSSRVKEVNGRIEFQSKIGAGTVVSVFIPGDQI